jgi:hypothetical protein
LKILGVFTIRMGCAPTGAAPAVNAKLSFEFGGEKKR